MAKNRKKNIEVKNLESGGVYDLLLALILGIAICLKGGYFPQSYLPILMAICFWLLIRSPGLTLPALWKDQVFVLLGGVFLCYIVADFFALGNRYTAILETLKIATELIFFLAVRLCQNKIILYRGVVTGCLFLAVFGLVTYLGIVEFPQAVIWSGRLPRMQSFLQYANVMALFMGIAYFLALYLGHLSQSVTQKRNYYFYSYFFLLTLFLTYSRGGIVVFLACVWLWVFLQVQQGQRGCWGWLGTLLQVAVAVVIAFSVALLISFKQPVLASLVLVLSFGIMFLLRRWETSSAIKPINGFWVRFALLVPPALLVLGGIILVVTGHSAMFLSRAGTFLERVITMQDAGTILQKYPWLGIGPGSWSSLQFQYQTAQYMVRYLHNGFLQLALDGGVFALVGFLLAVLRYYSCELRSYRVTGDSFKLLPGIALGFILLHSMMDIGFSFAGLLLIIAVILGSQQPSEIQGTQKNQTGKLSLYIPRILLAMVLISGIGSAGYFWHGELMFRKASDVISRGVYQGGSVMLQDSIPYRPGDAEVFLALAQTNLLSNQDETETISYLEQARRLDHYEPRYVEELINLAYQRNDLAEVYRYSRIFMGLKPRDPQGYRKADWSLQQMFSERKIDQGSYEQAEAEVQGELEQATQSLNPLAKYLH